MVVDAITTPGMATSVRSSSRTIGLAIPYQFAHALLVDSVLKSVSVARRRLAHERIAEVLVARTPDAVDRIARHWADSSNSAEAYVWSRRAATQRRWRSTQPR